MSDVETLAIKDIKIVATYQKESKLKKKFPILTSKSWEWLKFDTKYGIQSDSFTETCFLTPI